MSRRLAARLQASAAWLLLLAALGVATHCRHPLLYAFRAAETPVLLGVAILCAWSARRAFRASGGWRRRGLEPGLRLLAALLLLALTLGQEGWFRWQQYQVLRGGEAMARLGRHFVTGFRDFEELKTLAGRGLIGGIYLTKRNMSGESFDSLRRKIDEIQELRRQASQPPLLVMADQEGGQVAHLSPPLESIPSLATLAAAGPEKLAERARAYGERQGRSLAAVGVNMNLAPVVDLKPAVKSDWFDSRTQIDRRAIAQDPQTVALVAAAYSEGLSASGVLPTVKHFPGLGRVRGDTHFVKASLPFSIAQLAGDWQPFRAVTSRTDAAMMLAHVRVPAIDSFHPASLSHRLVQGLLRQKDGAGWNFQGLLITDDLNMEAAYAEGIGRAAALALDAGVDLVLVSYDPDQYYRALYDAARRWREGEISPKREAESVARLERFSRRFCGTGAPSGCGGIPQ